MFTSRRRVKQFAGVAVGAAAIALGLPAAAVATTPSAYTCTGGSIPSGTYLSVTVTGYCAVDDGPVTVNRNLVVGTNAELDATYAGSNLHVLGNLTAGPGSIVLLGCEPVAFDCSNRESSGIKPQDGIGATDHVINGSVISTSALMFIAHHNIVGVDVSQSGGGGGVTCNLFPFGENGPPAYSTWEDNTIGRDASVTGVNTCWNGFIRNDVGRNGNYSRNNTADPDGNEVTDNSFGRNLTCLSNNPAAQIGDGGGGPNTVLGLNIGECPAFIVKD